MSERSYITHGNKAGNAIGVRECPPENGGGITDQEAVKKLREAARSHHLPDGEYR